MAHDDAPAAVDASPAEAALAESTEPESEPGSVESHPARASRPIRRRPTIRRR